MNDLLNKRVKNYRFLVSQLKSNKFKLLNFKNYSTWPMALPILVKGSRLKFHNKLLNNHVYQE